MIDCVFQTSRLIIRKALAADSDVDMFFKLWTDPKVMVNVGFPMGLNITKNQIYERIEAKDKSEYDTLLVIVLKDINIPIGECKLGCPDNDGVSVTDIKILPRYWRKGYGKEVMKGLVDYLFINTDCKAIKATPNKANIASQKMQAAVGGKRVDEDTYKFPKKMRDYTTEVPHYIYMAYREDWEKNNMI